MPYILEPMTRYKEAVLDDVCQEWNQLMRGGQLLKNVLRNSPQRQDILFNKLVRSVVVKRSILHWKMARHAAATGLSRNYPYTPNTGFFLPYHLVTPAVEKKGAWMELICFRLLPWEELAFYWNSDKNLWGKSWKIHKVRGIWHVDTR